jgi:hypothetical protein
MYQIKVKQGWVWRHRICNLATPDVEMRLAQAKA